MLMSRVPKEMPLLIAQEVACKEKQRMYQMSPREVHQKDLNDTSKLRQEMIAQQGPTEKKR